MASNVISTPEMVDFDDYPDWFEIYNSEDFDVDISGYYLTDNLSIPVKWEIPNGTIIKAKGFIRFWADGEDRGPFSETGIKWHHTNFKLSVGGEEIGLFDPQENGIDSIKFGLQYSDVSYGRKPDGSNNWVYFGESTPGTNNTTSGVITPEFAEEPNFSVSGGVFNSAQILVLSSSVPNSEIRYTTNGSRPTSTSEKFSSSINITETTVIRARAFSPDKITSSIATHSYLINENQILPVISISAFPENLWDREIGIYANSLKGKIIPINFEFFETNGSAKINFKGGARISGQASFQYPQKPLTISAHDRFGDEFFDYKFFPNRSVNSYSEIYLRNSGTPDNRRTLFRDAFQHSLVINQMDIDCQAYRPVMSFINGEYWGIYNLREKLNANYLAANHNIDPNNVDLLEYEFDSIPVEIEGDAGEYNELLNFIRNNNLTIEKNYKYIESQIDVNEYLNYLITQIFCDNINWLNTNVRWWKEKKEGAKWRWIMLDLDWGFGTEYPGFTSRYSNNTLEMATSGVGTLLENSPWATELFRSLLTNLGFRNEFIQRFASHINTTFRTERTLQIVDSIKSVIETEMSRHINRWNDNPEDLIYNDPPIMNKVEWNNDAQVLWDFAKQRPSFMRSHIISFFKLSGSVNLTISNSTATSGSIIINNVRIPNNSSGVYFKDIPVNVKAIPKVGYRFVKWEGISNSNSDSISIVLTNDATLTAIFEANDISIIPSEINSALTLLKSNSPYYTESDININSEATLIVEPGVEIYMSNNSSINVYGKLEMSGSENEPIEIKPNTSSGFSSWGAICFTNSNKANKLKHVRIIGATRKLNDDNYKGAISSYKSNLVLDNIEINDAPFPIFVQYGNLELKNSSLHSDKTSDLINVKYASSAIIENCLFRGNDSYDTDAIDYDGISNGIIRGNRIYNFYGDNSDGIDLGEGSKDILIENNLIYNCYDKGISIGQASTAQIINNIIVNCAQGVAVKDDGSYAVIDKTTFYKNDYAVASYEKNFGAGGGNVDVKNSILSNSLKKPFKLDNLSRLEINYSLSDTDVLPGIGNVVGDPNFKNDFLLSSESPAINSGDPSTPKDNDGTNADMGAHVYNSNESHDLIFSEVHFNPIDGDDNEFIEIFNAGTSTLSLNGYKIKGGINFSFPSNSEILSKEYIVIAKNANQHSDKGYKVFVWSEGGLPNNWFSLELLNSSEDVVDLVSFSNIQEVTKQANGKGPALELKKTNLENLYINNWQASFYNGGSPGKDTEITLTKDLYINEIMANNLSTYQDESGDYDDWIELYNGSTNSIDVRGLYISNGITDSSYFQISNDDPKITTIEPNGYQVFWADEDLSQSALHLDFKLNRQGEIIKLAQKIDEQFVVIDSLVFPAQTADVSYGRKIDGTGDWRYVNYPTPNAPNSLPNTFNKGILLVNGISSIYENEKYNAYAQKAFWGKFPVSFWDCFEGDTYDYPQAVPEPIGSGNLSFEELIKFSTVIWIGNNYQGDLTVWNNSDVMKYVEFGGNLILLSRHGQSFIDQKMTEYLGITWTNDIRVDLNNCISNFSGLTNINLIAEQTFNDVFNIYLENYESTLLFSETASFNSYKGLGVWKKPEKGGIYKEDGGQFVFISGRPYRYNAQDLSSNIEYILENFFNESEIPVSVSNNDKLITSYNLYQNYPNPFNPSTIISYDIVSESKVELDIYNLLGQKVKTLVNEVQNNGRKSVVWNGKNNSGNIVSSGIYFYNIKIGDWTQIRKMIFMK